MIIKNSIFRDFDLSYVGVSDFRHRNRDPLPRYPPSPHFHLFSLINTFFRHFDLSYIGISYFQIRNRDPQAGKPPSLQFHLIPTINAIIRYFDLSYVDIFDFRHRNRDPHAGKPPSTKFQPKQTPKSWSSWGRPLQMSRMALFVSYPGITGTTLKSDQGEGPKLDYVLHDGHKFAIASRTLRGCRLAQKMYVKIRHFFAHVYSLGIKR